MNEIGPSHRLFASGIIEKAGFDIISPKPNILTAALAGIPYRDPAVYDQNATELRTVMPGEVANTGRWGNPPPF